MCDAHGRTLILIPIAARTIGRWITKLIDTTTAIMTVKVTFRSNRLRAYTIMTLPMTHWFWTPRAAMADGRAWQFAMQEVRVQGSTL